MPIRLILNSCHLRAWLRPPSSKLANSRVHLPTATASHCTKRGLLYPGDNVAGSSEHFLVLTSDNMLRLYHVHSLESPEQRFELQPNQKRC